MAQNGLKRPDLSPRQYLAIEALLISQTRQDASRIANVPVRTLNRWLCNSTFKMELDKRIDQLSHEAGKKLQMCLFDAIEALHEILKNENVMPSVRVSAARTILEYSLRYEEQTSILSRLEELEKNNADAV